MVDVSQIWDKKRVEGMTRIWRNPNELGSSDLEKDRHWRLIHSLFKFVEGESILDVGCGMGHLYSLAKDKYDYLGIDGSHEMIKTARLFYPDDQDKFQVGNAYDLSGYGIYDTVTATGLLLHLHYPALALRQLWERASRCVVFSVWIGKHTKKWEGRQPVYKRIFGIKDKNGVLQRCDTLSGVEMMLRTLSNVGKVAKEPFLNPYDGESNYIFKVSR